MAKEQIKIKVKSYEICGDTYYYPECEMTRGLCVMKKRKSLSKRDLDFLERFYEVEIT